MQCDERLENLRRLAANPHAALELGKAAEHIVCANIIMQGYRCYLSDQGLPYDLIVDIAGKFVRVQVRSTCFAKNVNAAGRQPRTAYSFNVRRRGKNGSQRLGASHCDVVALVALDIQTVAYLPIEIVGQTIQLIRPGSHITTRNGKRGWASAIDEFPFSRVLSGSSYERDKRSLTNCRHGHPYPKYLTFDKRGHSRCVECGRVESRERSRRNRQYAKQEI